MPETAVADDRLRQEVRLLGGMLGEVIRDEGGQDLYDRIEAVRQASVAYHRDPARTRRRGWSGCCRSCRWIRRWAWPTGSRSSPCWPMWPRTGRASAGRRPRRQRARGPTPWTAPWPGWPRPANRLMTPVPCWPRR